MLPALEADRGREIEGRAAIGADQREEAGEAGHEGTDDAFGGHAGMLPRAALRDRD